MDSRLVKAFTFFRENAGGVTGEAAAGALALARAERTAWEEDWTYTWQYDPEEPELGDHELWCPKPCPGHESWGCILRDEGGRPLASLWGILDPSQGYKRTVEAELALQAIGEQTAQAHDTHCTKCGAHLGG